MEPREYILPKPRGEGHFSDPGCFCPPPVYAPLRGETASPHAAGRPRISSDFVAMILEV